MKEIEILKQDVENTIEEKGLKSLSYVLFDESSSQQWAIHLFYKDGKFMINTRDERSYVIGKTVEFTSFYEAKNYFINKLEKFVEVTKKGKKLGFIPPYPSPLWDSSIEK